MSSPVLRRGEAEHPPSPARGMLEDGERNGYPSPLGNLGWEWKGELGERPSLEERSLGKGRKGPGQPAGLGDGDRLLAPSGLGLSPAAEGSGPGGMGPPPTFAKDAVRRERGTGGGGGRLPCAVLGRRRDAPETLPELPEGPVRRKGGERGIAGGSWVRSPGHPQVKPS